MYLEQGGPKYVSESVRRLHELRAKAIKSMHVIKSFKQLDTHSITAVHTDVRMHSKNIRQRIQYLVDVVQHVRSSEIWPQSNWTADSTAVSPESKGEDSKLIIGSL